MSAEQRDFSSPLWVIDGVPITNMTSSLTGTNALAEIDPESIESIEVLKDAAATSMYGSRAANGVILVTTKRGKTGNVPYGLTCLIHGLISLNTRQFLPVKNLGDIN